LKRRAIAVCPFKGAFGNSPAFQGWDDVIFSARKEPSV